VEKRTEGIASDTNTATLTATPHLSAQTDQQAQARHIKAPQRNDGPTWTAAASPQPHLKTETYLGDADDDHDGDDDDDDLEAIIMTASISAYPIHQPDLLELMDHSALHNNYNLLDDSRFDLPTYHNNHGFPEPPPMTNPNANPLFDEKESAFITSFFDVVDQAPSLDHEFQDGLANWTGQSDLRNDGLNTAQMTLQNGHYPSSYNMQQMDTNEPNYQFSSLNQQHHPILQNPPQHPQPFNPNQHAYLSRLQGQQQMPSSPDLTRALFTSRPGVHPDPYSNYPSVNIPAVNSRPQSTTHTPITTPKLQPYHFHTHDMGETSPATSNAQRMMDMSRSTGAPQYAPSTSRSTASESLSPQPNKPPRKKRRENLSEQQKRLNHISSEQKRRNLIHNGFQELQKLVPSLRSQKERGDSKSMVLLKTVDYIIEMKEGNERLRRMKGER
jgi:Helix-loop-helix DNA-binding domain